MSVLMYVIGGASIAVGVLAAGRYLLSLTTGARWSRRLHRVARISPAAKRGVRRRAWNNLGQSLGLVLVGTVFLLGVDDETARWLGAIAATALLIWQLGPAVTSYAQRRSAS